MSKVYSIHTLELLPGVTPREFEDFVHYELPAMVAWQGWTFTILKGNRGERTGKYLLLGEVKDLYTRDHYFADENKVTTADLKHAERFPYTMELVDKFHTLVNGFGDIYTDYTILETIR